MATSKQRTRTAIAALSLAAAVLLVSCPMEMESPLRVGIEQAVSEAGRVATPVFSPTGGTYSRDQMIEITCETADAAIYFTTDGADPTTASPRYEGAIELAGDGAELTLKAIGVQGGLDRSLVAQATFTIDYETVSTPQFDPRGGTYTADQAVTITRDTPDATIYYTTDNTTPTNTSLRYDEPVVVRGDLAGTSSTVVRAYAIADHMKDSGEVSETYVIEYPLVTTPVIDPAAGTYFEPQSVSMSVMPAHADIRYTTDGSQPSATHGTLYEGPFALNDDATIKAVGYGDGLRTSGTALAAFIVVYPGHLDMSFGENGIATTMIGADDDLGYGLAIQTDGKLVVAGRSVNGSGSDIALARFTHEGAVDTTFGTDGAVTVTIGSERDEAQGIAIQADGKIVVAGSTSADMDNNYDFALVRFTSTGTLDTGFGTAGIVTTSFSPMWDAGHAVAIQTDGRIVVAGYGYNGTDTDFALARYLSTGVLDTDFGSGGKVTTSIQEWDEARGVAIQGDGKIVLAGFADGDFALARYTTTGALDTAFGTAGTVTTPVGPSGGRAYAILIQPDGKIVVAGSRNNGADDDLAVVRYTSVGALDSGFGNGGTAIADIMGSEEAHEIAMQSDGKILIGGRAGGDFAIVRLTSSGMLDSSFGTDGTVTTRIGTFSNGHAVAVQGDGKIVVAGYGTEGTNKVFALARYWP